MKLNELRAGECGQIISVGGIGALRRRLMDMGLTPGAKISVRKKAPLGDPIEICIRGYQLTLRKEDIANIAVVKLTIAGDHKQRVHPGFVGISHRRGYRGGKP